MTDDELIARLRVTAEWVIGKEAADRIEALVKDKERMGREVNMARYGQPDFAWSVHKQQMADLQARAERLEAALRDVLRYLENDLANVPSADPERRIARAALKGEDK